jgi:hypothetical protein
MGAVVQCSAAMGAVVLQWMQWRSAAMGADGANGCSGFLCLTAFWPFGFVLR